jgi:hypothetical protein
MQENEPGPGFARLFHGNGMRWSRSLRSVATRIVAGCVQRRPSRNPAWHTPHIPEACHRRKGRDVPESTSECDLSHIVRMCPAQGHLS